MGRLAGSWEPPAWGGSWAGLLLAASVLGSCLQPVPAQLSIVITPQSPAVGGAVSLAPQPPQNLTLCKWYRATNTEDETRRIFSYTGTAQINGPAHTGRETAGLGCALNIAGLMLSDTGNYTVQMDLSDGLAQTLRVDLPVYEMLPKPMVTPSQTHVLENGTFNLTCNSSPSTNTLLWLWNTTYLSTDQRLELSSDNRTLTVLNVTRSDTGSYQCEVTNPVSTNRSEPSTVTVAYGPDSARIDPPGPITHPLGSPLTLTCVADSVPASHYHWVHNGTNTNENGSSWTINPMTWAQQGTFRCQAHNPNTNLTACASVTVQVTESPGTSLSAGAIVGIVIGTVAGVVLVGVLAFFLYSGRQSTTPQGSETTPPVYENVPPAAQLCPVAHPRSPPDTSHTYETLQPGQEHVYDQLRR